MIIVALDLSFLNRQTRHEAALEDDLPLLSMKVRGSGNNIDHQYFDIYVLFRLNCAMVSLSILYKLRKQRKIVPN